MLDIKKDAIYALRLQRFSNKCGTITLNGLALLFLIKKGMSISRLFETGAVGIKFKGRMRQKLITDIEKSIEVQIKPKYSKDILKLINIINFIKNKPNSDVTGQLVEIKEEVNLTQSYLALVPISDCITKTKLIPYDVSMEIPIIDTIKYSTHFLTGNGLFVSPEKPLLVKLGAIDFSVRYGNPSFENINVPDELKEFMDAVEDYCKMGIEFQITKREGIRT